MKKANKIWFKNKSYGYGWQPANKEGWAVLLGYLALAGGLSIWKIPQLEQHSGGWILLHYILPFSFLTGLLLGLSISMGEKPEWRWGKLRGKEAIVPNFIVINVVILILIAMVGFIFFKGL